MKKRIDLHIHSTYSDGKLTPMEIVALSREKGLDIISITDHNSIDAYKELSNIKGTGLITGIELDVEFCNTHFHLLCYGFPFPCEEMDELLLKIKSQRICTILNVLDILKKQNIPISHEKLFKQGITLENIKKQFIENQIVEKFDEVFNSDLIKSQKFYYPNAKDVIKLVHLLKGITCIAHPRRISNDDTAIMNLISKLVDCGLDGIECYHPLNDTVLKNKLLRFSEKNNLIITGGSDMHETDTDFDIILDDINNVCKLVYI